MFAVFSSTASNVDLFNVMIRYFEPGNRIAKSCEIENELFASPDDPRVNLIPDKDARNNARTHFRSVVFFMLGSQQVVDFETERDQQVIEFSTERNSYCVL